MSSLLASQSSVPRSDCCEATHLCVSTSTTRQPARCRWRQTCRPLVLFAPAQSRQTLLIPPVHGIADLQAKLRRQLFARLWGPDNPAWLWTCLMEQERAAR